jgi:hypothetical protein
LTKADLDRAEDLKAPMASTEMSVVLLVLILFSSFHAKVRLKEELNGSSSRKGYPSLLPLLLQLTWGHRMTGHLLRVADELLLAASGSGF